MNASIRTAWAARVHAEYRSAALVQQLGHVWLVAGASPDLVREAHAVVQDELNHAADALAVLAEAGGEMAPIDEADLSLPWPTSPARQAALVGALELLALNESLAVPLFAAMRARATVPRVAAALDRISVDEPRHAALGWTFLAWAVAAWPDARATLEGLWPRAVRGLMEAYGCARGERWEDDDPRFAWGLLDGARYAEILDAHVTRRLPARATELGLEVEGA